MGRRVVVRRLTPVLAPGRVQSSVLKLKICLVLVTALSWVLRRALVVVLE